MHKTYVKSQPCIHADIPYDEELSHTDPALACGKPSFRKAHGYYCIDHYKDQQTKIPAKPRKQQPRFWKGDVRAEIDCREIARQEKQIIANLTDNNRIKVRVFGALEPIILQTVGL